MNFAESDGIGFIEFVAVWSVGVESVDVGSVGVEFGETEFVGFVDVEFVDIEFVDVEFFDVEFGDAEFFDLEFGGVEFVDVEFGDVEFGDVGFAGVEFGVCEINFVTVILFLLVSDTSLFILFSFGNVLHWIWMAFRCLQIIAYMEIFNKNIIVTAVT